MSDGDTPSSRQTGLSRRALLATTAGAVTLSAGRAAATTPAEQIVADPPDSDRPAAVAQACIEALDAGDRGVVNKLIADDGILSTWSEQELDWVGSLEITYVSFETVAQRLLVDEYMNPRVMIVVGGWSSFEAIRPCLNTPTESM